MLYLYHTTRHNINVVVPSPCRTDNAVKNRFSTLCKKRAKHHIISEENNNSCIHHSNKKIMVEPSANKQQNRYEQNKANRERFTAIMHISLLLCRYIGSNHVDTTHDITGAKSRPPLAVLTQNFNNLSCVQAHCHLDSNTKPKPCDCKSS